MSNTAFGEPLRISLKDCEKYQIRIGTNRIILGLEWSKGNSGSPDLLMYIVNDAAPIELNSTRSTPICGQANSMFPTNQVNDIASQRTHTTLPQNHEFHPNVFPPIHHSTHSQLEGRNAHANGYQSVLTPTNSSPLSSGLMPSENGAQMKQFRTSAIISPLSTPSNCSSDTQHSPKAASPQSLCSTALKPMYCTCKKLNQSHEDHCPVTESQKPLPISTDSPTSCSQQFYTCPINQQWTSVSHSTVQCGMSNIPQNDQLRVRTSIVTNPFRSTVPFQGQQVRPQTVTTMLHQPITGSFNTQNNSLNKTPNKRGVKRNSGTSDELRQMPNSETSLTTTEILNSSKVKVFNPRTKRQSTQNVLYGPLSDMIVDKLPIPYEQISHEKNEQSINDRYHVPATNESSIQSNPPRSQPLLSIIYEDSTSSTDTMKTKNGTSPSSSPVQLDPTLLSDKTYGEKITSQKVHEVIESVIKNGTKNDLVIDTTKQGLSNQSQIQASNEFHLQPNNCFPSSFQQSSVTPTNHVIQQLQLTTTNSKSSLSTSTKRKPQRRGKKEKKSTKNVHASSVFPISELSAQSSMTSSINRSIPTSLNTIDERLKSIFPHSQVLTNGLNVNSLLNIGIPGSDFFIDRFKNSQNQHSNESDFCDLDLDEEPFPSTPNNGFPISNPPSSTIFMQPEPQNSSDNSGNLTHFVSHPININGHFAYSLSTTHSTVSPNNQQSSPLDRTNYLQKCFSPSIVSFVSMPNSHRSDLTTASPVSTDKKQFETQPVLDFENIFLFDN